MNIIKNYNNIRYKILLLKKQKNAIILAHFYQSPEIQDIADYVGDSYFLAKIAKRIKSDIIVFAGVKFMGETAKILNNNTKVLLPEPEAGCSLEESCPVNKFENFIKKYKNHIIITYVNSSIEIKALSDIICTSSNAVKIINSIPKDKKIIFAPDKNLGNYIMKKTGRDMVLWDGSCHVHNRLHIEKVIEMKNKYKNSILVAHPECQGAILNISDFVGSTSQIIEYSKKIKKENIIVATETGILHKLKEQSPNKNFYIVPSDESCSCNDCNYMKMITLEKILKSLEEEKFEVKIEDNLRLKALKPIEEMIRITSL